MNRVNHPYDQGYWRRYDRRGRPPEGQEFALMRNGWDDCDAELTFELEDKVAALSAAGQPEGGEA